MTIARLSKLAIVIAAATAVAATVVSGAPARAQTKQAAQTKPSKPSASTQHKVAIQVNQNDKAVMDLALNNAKNIAEYFKGKGETVAIELVAYGPGLHMLRSDTSPVKERISEMSLENPNMTFAAFGNTQANPANAENKPVPLN